MPITEDTFKKIITDYYIQLIMNADKDSASPMFHDPGDYMGIASWVDHHSVDEDLMADFDRFSGKTQEEFKDFLYNAENNDPFIKKVLNNLPKKISEYQMDNPQAAVTMDIAQIMDNASKKAIEDGKAKIKAQKEAHPENFADIRKFEGNLKKLTGISFVAEIMESDCIRNNEGKNYDVNQGISDTEKANNYIKQVFNDACNGNGFLVTSKENGKINVRAFVANADGDLEPALPIAYYREFLKLKEELDNTGDFLSTDIKEFDELNKQINDGIKLFKDKKLDQKQCLRNSDVKNLIENAAKCCEDYEKHYAKIEPIADRQRNRMAIMSRIKNLYSMCDRGIVGINKPEALKEKLALKLINIAAIDAQNHGSKIRKKRAKQVQTDDKLQKKCIEKVLKNKYFNKMIENVNEKDLKNLLKQDDEALKDKFMDAVNQVRKEKETLKGADRKRKDSFVMKNKMAASAGLTN